jgi:hypothetical protein
VKVNKCGIEEKQYTFSGSGLANDHDGMVRQAVLFLMNGRMKKKLKIDLEAVERNLWASKLSIRHREFLEEQIAEYKDKGEIALWDEKRFDELSRRLSDFLGIRTRVKKVVETVLGNAQLTDDLSSIVKSIIPDATEQLAVNLCQCFLNDLSMSEGEIGAKIYKRWCESFKER